jgi:cyclopropane-fatty-acyl-phospholipid synthase
MSEPDEVRVWTGEQGPAAVSAAAPADAGHAPGEPLPPTRDAVRDALDHARHAAAILFGAPGTRPFAIRYWTGDVEPSRTGVPSATVVIARPGALRRMLLPPSELSIVEALMSGDVDVDGDLESLIGMAEEIRARIASPSIAARLAWHLFRLPSESAPSPVRASRAAETVQRDGHAHQPARDRAAIRYHYDVGNDFYALWLDARMVYSCAVYEHEVDPEEGLAQAQVAKLDLVCRKLGLRPGDRLLDVGCGWGALVIHAAEHYGVNAVGITLSDAQAALASERIAAAGIADRCRVEIRDYRALAPLGPFDRISSVGMVEHVGIAKLPEYFAALYAALRPGGLLLNHGIVSVNAARPAGPWSWLERRLWKRDAFIDQYVFPDARLTTLAPVIALGEAAGFETRDVESLREHYARTLRAWVRRLERRRDDAVRLADLRTYRTWRLYMSASAWGFAQGSINVVQTLFAKPNAGKAEVPLRRSL